VVIGLVAMLTVPIAPTVSSFTASTSGTSTRFVKSVGDSRMAHVDGSWTSSGATVDFVITNQAPSPDCVVCVGTLYFSQSGGYGQFALYDSGPFYVLVVQTGSGTASTQIQVTVTSALL
jgi:hypothetical protein